MLITYPFDSTALDLNPQFQTPNNLKNGVMSFTLGDQKFMIEPNTPASEGPSKVLRCPNVAGSGLIPAAGTYGPHQDYVFLRNSAEYSYTTRLVAAGGVIEKIMSAGAVAGDEGRMILYKGATLAQVEVGGWTARLIRPFIINAADLSARDTGWPLAGTAPSIDVPSKSVVDNGGDGYNHI